MDGNRGDFMRLLRRRTSRGGPWGPLSPTRLVPQLLQSICQLLHSGDIHQPLQKLRMSSAHSPAAFLSGRFKPHCADPHRRFSGGQVKSGGCWNKVISSPPVQSLLSLPVHVRGHLSSGLAGLLSISGSLHRYFIFL